VRSVLILAALSAGIVSAQSIDFSLLEVPASGNPLTITNNSTVQVAATGVGVATPVTIQATYIGSTQATIATQPVITQGSTQFALTVPAKETFPLVLTKGQVLTFTMTYTPANSSAASAQVIIPYSEPSSNGGTATNSITLLFEGFAPSVSLSYFITPANGTTPNILPIASGGTITFPATLINTTATGGLQINNVGTGPAYITGITGPPATSPFQTGGTPLISPTAPFTLAPNMALPIDLFYNPTKVETDKATITITFQDGTVDTINLAGTGATSTYTYSYLSAGTTPTTVVAGGTITLPSVPLATAGTTPASSQVIVTVTNSGNANGTINSIAAVPNPPFAITTQPTVPPTLKPGDTENFTISYTPTQVGPQKGTLQVGSDTFVLAGTGQGAQLTFSYASGGATVSLGTSGEVVFPSLDISQSEQVLFTVMNSGTTTTTLSLVATLPPFSVPSLSPISLMAGQSTTFPITFTPTALGPVTETLVINSTSVILGGAGKTPPSIPSYTISGPSGNVAPASQGNVSLTLADPYSVDLDGVLTLTTNGNFGTDPSVQFSTGSSAGNRTVDFVIPAGSTGANFAGQGSQILLQTGTVAETVTLAPTFSTTAGVPVTPNSPPTLEFTIPSSAPVLESLQVTDESATGFTLLILGYSTTRSLATLTVTFTPASGFNLTTTSYPFDLTGASASWFQSVSSQGFGGQFQITLPFTLTGSVGKNQTPIQAIASVSATVSNGSGTSGSVQSPVQ
jgi:hypothetical protein